MDEEELMNIVRDKKLSSKELTAKLEKLTSLGIDYPYLLCKYIVAYPDKYKKKKVSISLWEFAQWVVSNKDKSEIINNVHNGLQEMHKHLEDMDRR
jgi:penicillin V acylase-like amidase (Ntn superfamily)